MTVNKMLMFLLLLFLARKGSAQGDTLHRKIKEVICYKCYVILGRRDSCELEERHPMDWVDSSLRTNELPLTKGPDDSLKNYFTSTYIYKYKDSTQILQTFNRLGQLIEKLSLDIRAHPDTLLYTRILYLYDENARLTREVMVDGNNQISMQKTYEYDSTGALKYYEDAPGLKITILYNLNGSFREIKEFDPFSRKTVMTKYVYDDKRHLLIRKEEYSNGKMDFYRKYEYRE